MKLTIDTDSLKGWLKGQILGTGELFPAAQELLSLPIVRNTIFILVLVALIMTATVIHTTKELAWDFSAKGYQTAGELFKGPIGIVFLAIPLVALFASNHRSVQTMRQMKLTNAQIELAAGQNLFANYYKHVEEFSKWCDHIQGPGSVKSKRKLHKAIFPVARQGNFSANASFLKAYELHIEQLRAGLIALGKESIGTAALVAIFQNMHGFSEIFWLSMPARQEGGIIFQLDNWKIDLPQSGVKGFIDDAIKFARAIDELLSFDPDYESNETTRQVFSVNTARVVRDPNQLQPFEFIELR